MFRFLRLRLTVLYLLGALVLVAAVDAAVYFLLQHNYQASIDLALEHRAALALHEVGEPLPPAFARSEQEWYAGRGGTPTPVLLPGGEEQEASGDAENPETPSAAPVALWQANEPEFDSELSPITLTAVRADGGADIISGGKNLSVDAEAAAAARQSGLDFRTVENSSGNRVRLLTLRLSGVPGYSLLQVGRSLADQDRILAGLAMGLLEWGVVFALVLAAVSWWLSGRALRSAQEAWDKQQAFVAHAGHELRTPLTMIRAAAEVTKRHLPASDQRQDAIGEIISETDRMGRLVGDLLLLSRLDAGAVRLETQSVDLAPLLAEIVQSFGYAARERGVGLSAGSIQGKVKADEPRLRQVVLILLDNALRHSPRGSAMEIEAAAEGSKIFLTVRDQGAGIPPEDLPHVFERFYRGRGEGAEGGSGLGLAIAKELVEAMRGKIRMESRPGRGTTATVELESAG
jgi:signal transduction histidine kinase